VAASRLQEPARQRHIGQFVVVAGLLRASGYGPFRLPFPRSLKDGLGACPTLTFLLRRTICDHLRRSRPEKILNVFQRIRLRFFRACGLASGRTSFASLRRQCRTGSLVWRITSPRESVFEFNPIIPLYRYRHETERGTSWDLFGGMVGMDRAKEQTRMKHFWLSL
jgi:hypothetical protein